MTTHLTLVGADKAQPSNDFITFLSGANADYIAELYARYVQDAASVDASWQEFFAALGDSDRDVLAELTGAPWRADTARIIQTTAAAAKSAAPQTVATIKTDAPAPVTSESLLADNWRRYGHFAAQLDPLGLVAPRGHDTLAAHPLAAIYGSTTGFEYMHIADSVARNWWQDRIENPQPKPANAAQKQILGDLVRAQGMEDFLAKKFVGVKRFGLEGSESTIVALEQILLRGAELGVVETSLGMAHRGRLNVLTNICHKPFVKLLAEFQGVAPNPEGVPGSSDVKYHMGYSNDRDFNGRKIHLSLAANPSHLEFVNTVAQGKARAKQFQKGGKQVPYPETTKQQVLPLLLHGDAAFAGQGVVAEALMMSDLDGYSTGGTIHVITNNQVGFTTNPIQARSGPYSSDVAKMIDAPIIHVNGDDVEAVARAAQLAIEWRQEFGRDVVLDLIGYRRHGHNESDEPAFTQPLMYAKIKEQPSTRDVYAQKLIAAGTLSADDVAKLIETHRSECEAAFAATSTYKPNKADWLEGAWAGINQAPPGAISGEAWMAAGSTATALPLDTLKDIGMKLGAAPTTIETNPKILRQLEAKQQMMQSGEDIDWGTAELLAYGSLLGEGYPVRLSGQDVERGTFSHRHAVLTCQKSGAKYTPLNNLAPKQAKIEVWNSPLSEAAVLGFEYGFSISEPNSLTLWEAQFGDFTNGAQVLIDQFLASAEAKWLRLCGMVLLLPHGYEGQGPEHSSARFERWLQLCAEDNMQVCNISTPANFFHALRRQLHRNFRKPLIVMSPKSLLRHKRCVSKLTDFGPGSSFKTVIGETATTLKAKDAIRRVVLCTGKVYYDLLQARDDKTVTDVALVRVEQVYPFPHLALKEVLAEYPNAEVVWCQEEPKNQGAWDFVHHRIEKALRELQHRTQRPRYVGRAVAAAPACGQLSRHNAEQSKLVAEALA